MMASCVVRRASAVAIALAVVALPGRLVAQCPDGAPPPCTAPRQALREAARVADPGRIAVLPFRVTAADTMLGEGVAELLAAEFTGERGPLAMHMGTVIRSWRAAGGSARVPLTQDVAVRTARAMGAGQVLEGSIVGLGSRLTVTASVLSVADGRTRRSEPVRGSTDSLDVLLSRLTTTLLALAGAESREGTRGVMTASPAAMREYLHGMAAWRRSQTAEASAAFERAFRQDSLFARAAFMRHWIASWFAQPVAPRWAQTAWALRDRLAAADRVLLAAQLGDEFPAQRSPQQNLAERVRAASLLPESPEAQYLAGDWLFHWGAADAPDALERARRYFVRSWDLDSQTTVLAHLVSTAILLADTPLVRSLRPTVTGTVADRFSTAWLVAAFLDDGALLARLRSGTFDSVVAAGAWDVVGKLRATAADEYVSRIRQRDPRWLRMRLAIQAMQGRPDAVRASLAQAPPATPDDAVFVTWLALQGDLDSASGAAAVAQLERMTGLDEAAAARRACDVALWHAWWGSGPAWPSAISARDDDLICPALVNLLRAWRAGAPDIAARLTAADSLVHWRRAGVGRGAFVGYENVVLARVWESRGNVPRAFSAIRLQRVGLFGVPGRGKILREEGRLALLVGDTASAVRAYRMYLGYRQDAEPALHAERDSVRSALALLQARR
jgi:hypothetical protein